MSKGLAQIMKQAQMMQQKMGKLQEEAAERTAEVTTGGGAVTVVVNGKNQVLSLVIKKEAVDPEDVEMDRREDIERSARDLLLVERARGWLLEGDE